MSNDTIRTEHGYDATRRELHDDTITSLAVLADATTITVSLTPLAFFSRRQVMPRCQPPL